MHLKGTHKTIINQMEVLEELKRVAKHSHIKNILLHPRSLKSKKLDNLPEIVITKNV